MYNIINQNINLNDKSIIYHSNNYGDFTIIEDIGMVNKVHKVKIKFINSGFETIVQLNQVKYGTIRDATIFPINDDIVIDPNIIYHSNNYGDFIMLEMAHKVQNDTHRFVKIQFINTNSTKIVPYQEALRGNVKDDKYDNIDYNRVYDSVKSGKFVILKKLNYDGSNRRVLIKFLDTGEIRNVRLDHALQGNVLDNTVARVCNSIGVSGNTHIKEYNAYYKRWVHMLERCYDETNPTYKYYGAIGITVSERWHYFENYMYDIQRIPGFSKVISDVNNKYCIDKDLLQFNVPKNKVIYSKDTCVWLSAKDNVSLIKTIPYILSTGSSFNIMCDGNFFAVLKMGQYVESNIYPSIVSIYDRLQYLSTTNLI